MCGIAGIVDTKPIDRNIVRRMADVIEHRGPDDYGEYISQNCCLSMRRLSIIDIDGGQQPVYNEDDSITVVYNGEIYNYLELREELIRQGHIFKSNTDTEVIVHLYEEYGYEFISKLNGMFAIALYDINKQELILARDRVGKKPLFFYYKDNRVTFGSEIKCILEDPLVGKSPNLNGLYKYLALQYVPAPETAFGGIYNIMPGTYAVYKDGIFSSDRYWRLIWDIKYDNYDDAKRDLRELVIDSVERRLISDVPLGVFLSGGVDSTIVTGIMSHILGRDVHTFSIGFNEQNFNELPYADFVAEQFNTQHHTKIVTPNIENIMDELTHHYDQPFGDCSCIPCYYLSEFAKDYITVALNGDGSDELFGGYTRYMRMSQSDGRPESYIPFMLIWQPHIRKNILLSEFKDSMGYIDAPDYLKLLYNRSDSDSVNNAMYCDIHSYLPEDIIVKIERTTMAHSIESRSPLLDYRLLELGASIPGIWKVNSNDFKIILKDAFSDILDDKISKRPKRGFAVPVGEWFRGDLRSFMLSYLSNKFYKRGIFLQGGVEGYIKQNDSGIDHGHRLWILMSLESWFRKYID